MNIHSSAAESSKAHSRLAESAPVSQGDERWVHRRPVWRERELALAWPLELLENFSLRMAGHGMCISRALMVCDRQYAVQQLTYAKGMDDPHLHDMAVQLFTHYEARPSGVRALH